MRSCVKLGAAWLLCIHIAAAASSSAAGSVLFDSVLREARARYTDAGTRLTQEELANTVTESLKKASQLLGLNLPVVRGDCEFDFSAFCPEGWVSSGDGVHCEVAHADSADAGCCGSQLDMRDKSPLDKLSLSNMCNLKWPCRTSSAYVSLDEGICPRFWHREGEECVADHTYMGPCDTRLNLAGKSLQEREDIARKCGLAYSRATGLLDESSDWSADCPLGWSLHEDGTCVKNADQTAGMCGGVLKFVDIRDKRDKSRRCGLVPIKGAKVESHCPLGWRYDADNELCLAPPSYTGPCQLRMDFRNYTTEEKALWAHVCGGSFLDGGVTKEEPTKSTSNVSYRSGALDHDLSVVRFSKPAKDVRVIEKQLDDGWRQFDGVCVAGETYSRIMPGCRTIHHLSDEYEERCRVSHRTDDVLEDFVRAYCPLGWRIRRVYYGDLVRHICVAPSAWSEPQKVECGGTTVDFSTRSPGFKRRWAFACGQRFPKFTDTNAARCAENFYWRCPAEWTHDGEDCVAPKHYGGPCPPKVPVSQLASPSMKAAFSQRCHAAWPCIGYCEKDYSADCPDGWTRTEEGCKLSSDSGGGSCGNHIVVPKSVRWGPGPKEELEYACDVHWTCKKV
ncbi:Plasmodium falciparum CPW-WPC domain containing protein, putative [Babesia bigemina]|uniref:Plasmodium falciparum CPW-WPC domain containing protein, putative n=1 Tax=Babesia bigemina TaxID=5866 RepID=A0A061D425_BABBI|nr:Plasmodium falciparum CPW-WPC domain containing protein, putative [Babesia bigemina]CDR95303.1 Plasmodium falciparum CPW-WPC domain containing protein, putative [Babesia bigemina]|eukprot:XP_012767489.1 Plasmodium falciparum CPW-WPC domain containing protein, putative [Babesia bigemina]